MNWKAELDALIEQTMALAKMANGETIKPVVPLSLVEEALAQRRQARRPAEAALRQEDRHAALCAGRRPRGQRGS